MKITVQLSHCPIFCAKSTKHRSFIHKITGVESLTKLRVILIIIITRKIVGNGREKKKA